MPELNGYDAARRIREHASGKNLVLIALTGWGQDEDRQRSRDAGFDGHLAKPASYADLRLFFVANQAVSLSVIVQFCSQVRRMLAGG
jgi:CheY-like chemotaxis protein